MDRIKSPPHDNAMEEGMGKKMITPRMYQQEVVEQIEFHLSSRRRVLVVSPGASGKTVMIALLAARALANGIKRCLVVSHRKEIIEQASRTLGAFSIDRVGFMGVGRKTDLDAQVVVANIASLHRGWSRLPDPGLVIVDEAHHVLAPRYNETVRLWTKAQQVGFTATPFRLDGRGLGGFYDQMLIAAKPSELIEQGYVAQPKVFRAPREFMPDLDNVKIAMGDYNLVQLERATNQRGLVGNVVENWMRHGQGRRTIAFGCSIPHSQTIVERFRAVGIQAEHLDGTMDEQERVEKIEKFERGETTILSNCMVLSEGYDLPACEVVILARPTRSLGLYLQQAARVMRPKQDGSGRPIVLDHGRLLETFGVPEADRPYILTDKRQPREVSGGHPVKDCPACGAVNPAGIAACRECHEAFPQTTRVPGETQDILTEYDEDQRSKMESRIRAYLEEKGERDDAWVERTVQLWVGFRAKAATR